MCQVRVELTQKYLNVLFRRKIKQEMRMGGCHARNPPEHLNFLVLGDVIEPQRAQSSENF